MTTRKYVKPMVLTDLHQENKREESVYRAAKGAAYMVGRSMRKGAVPTLGTADRKTPLQNGLKRNTSNQGA